MNTTLLVGMPATVVIGFQYYAGKIVRVISENQIDISINGWDGFSTYTKNDNGIWYAEDRTATIGKAVTMRGCWL